MTFDERLRAWRNGLVGSARFQEFANRFWPLRIIARRRAASLFSTVSGFIHSQVLFACVETGLFHFLKDGPRTAREIARHTGIAESQLSRLLEPALALKLVSRDRQGRWWLADAGAVVAGNAGIEAMIRHHAMVYRDLADPLRLLKDPGLATETQDYWSYVRGPDVDPAAAAQYSALMTASQDMLIAEVLAAISLNDKKTLLDIGGGEGAFLRAAGERYPQLNLWLFDLASVPGPQGRIERFSGDFFQTPLPGGADCITPASGRVRPRGCTGRHPAEECAAGDGARRHAGHRRTDGGAGRGSIARCRLFRLLFSRHALGPLPHPAAHPRPAEAGRIFPQPLCSDARSAVSRDHYGKCVNFG